MVQNGFETPAMVSLLYKGRRDVSSASSLSLTYFTKDDETARIESRFLPSLPPNPPNRWTSR